MRITKKLIERCSMALIMALPVAYLFTTQIFALAGAHGEEVLAETPYQEEWLETNDFHTGEDFKFVFDESITLPNVNQIYRFNFKLEDELVEKTFFGITFYTGRIAYDIQITGTTTQFSPYNPQYWEDGWYSYPSWATIYFNIVSVPDIGLLNYGTLYYKNPVQNTNYRDSLFNNMFGESNFLTEWGEDVLGDNPHGFAPFASMIKYLDVNMLHLGEKNYGLMAYGQLYYMLNVSVFYLIYKTMVFIPNMITKLFNWFGKENNEND